MASSAAGNYRNFAFVPVAAHHDADCRVNIKARQVAMLSGKNNTLNRIIDQLFTLVKKESGHVFQKLSKPYAKHSR